MAGSFFFKQSVNFLLLPHGDTQCIKLVGFFVIQLGQCVCENAGTLGVRDTWLVLGVCHFETPPADMPARAAAVECILGGDCKPFGSVPGTESSPCGVSAGSVAPACASLRCVNHNSVLAAKIFNVACKGENTGRALLLLYGLQ